MADAYSVISDLRDTLDKYEQDIREIDSYQYDLDSYHVHYDAFTASKSSPSFQLYQIKDTIDNRIDEQKVLRRRLNESSTSFTKFKQYLKRFYEAILPEVKKLYQKNEFKNARGLILEQSDIIDSFSVGTSVKFKLEEIVHLTAIKCQFEDLKKASKISAKEAEIFYTDVAEYYRAMSQDMFDEVVPFALSTYEKELEKKKEIDLDYALEIIDRCDEYDSMCNRNPKLIGDILDRLIEFANSYYDKTAERLYRIKKDLEGCVTLFDKNQASKVELKTNFKPFANDKDDLVTSFYNDNLDSLDEDKLGDTIFTVIAQTFGINSKASTLFLNGHKAIDIEDRNISDFENNYKILMAPIRTNSNNPHLAHKLAFFFSQNSSLDTLLGCVYIIGKHLDYCNCELFLKEALKEIKDAQKYSLIRPNNICLACTTLNFSNKVSDEIKKENKKILTKYLNNPEAAYYCAAHKDSDVLHTALRIYRPYKYYYKKPKYVLPGKKEFASVPAYKTILKMALFYLLEVVLLGTGIFFVSFTNNMNVYPIIIGALSGLILSLSNTLLLVKLRKEYGECSTAHYIACIVSMGLELLIAGGNIFALFNPSNNLTINMSASLWLTSYIYLVITTVHLWFNKSFNVRKGHRILLVAKILLCVLVAGLLVIGIVTGKLKDLLAP